MRFGGATDIPPSVFEEEVTTQVVMEETVSSKDDEVSEKASPNVNETAPIPVCKLCRSFYLLSEFI